MLAPQRLLDWLRVLVLCFTSWVPFVSAQQSAPTSDLSAKLEFFESKIRPVLIEHCYECHSAEAKTVQAGLVLDTAQGLLNGGDSGPAILPGQSDASLMIQAIRYESTQMPPRGKLPDEVIANFVHWIQDGAIDPRVGDSVPMKKQIDFQRAREFWSFVPPKAPTVPSPARVDWGTTTIDRFVLAAMESQNLSPVPKSGKRELIRRATYDLTGLPPIPEDIESFVNDTSPEAFAKVVDRLVNSQAYGQRWGRYWLDIARYSEDQAHTFSVQPNTHGYRYRDWVISALNADMPFDLFIKYQIAADLMDIDETERLRNLPALGYFGLGAQYYKNTDAAKAAADELDDRIDTLTRGFLGLTVSCARCHDHKFDPIPQQDYYSLAGVFHSSRLHNTPLVSSAEVERFHTAQQKIKKLEESVQQTIASNGPKLRESRVAEVSKYLLATDAFRSAKANDASVKVDSFAKERELDEVVLKRWLDYLESKQSKSEVVFQPWLESLEIKSPDATSDTDRNSQMAQKNQTAQSTQRHLELLLRKRDGVLTQDEQSELSGLDMSETKASGGARFISPLVTKNRPTVSIDVDLTGAKELFLVINDGGNGPSCDHADWLEPKLVTASGELALTELKWRSVEATFGKVNINQGVTGQPLRVAGKTYSNGLGSHSTCVISYELPEDIVRFTATGGLDNSGSDQGGDCGSNAAVQFRVYTEKPTDIQMGQSDVLANVFGDKGIFSMDIPTMERMLPEEVRSTLSIQRSELEQLRSNAPPMYPIAHGIADSNPSDLKVMVRGNPANLGDTAPRRFLRILSRTEEPQAFVKGSGRLELAEAIASPENPLTARVIVNRIWQHHFGRGLVGTPDNFGKLGEAPTHPELLDYLTIQFIEQGWSLKKMHRQIMLSETYQLSTQRDERNMQIDADNRFLWRMNRRRLDVEAWRDGLLAVSGRLDAKLEGSSTNLADAGNTRRTIYGFISRHELDNMLRLFDFPDANITSSTRAETTVPQQQLFVLNSPFMVEQSKAFAARIKDQAGQGIEDQIRYAYLLAFGRPVTDPELDIGVEYLQGVDSQEGQEPSQLDRLQRYAQALLASNEFMYLD